MAFQVVKTFVVEAPPAAVWQFLIDPRRVAGCLPGAAITGQIDEKTFTGTMTVKVGPVTTSYKGKVVFQRLDAAAYVAEIIASGQDIKGKGGASMKLSSTLNETAPGQTEITATSDLSITGILAQMGRGMIQDVSDELFQIFSQRVRAEIEGASPAPADQAPASAPAPVAAEASAPASAPAEQAHLDLGAIGARAASRAALRMAVRPPVWIALAVIAGLVYWMFIR
jgi:hypothetical protein